MRCPARRAPTVRILLPLTLLWLSVGGPRAADRPATEEERRQLLARVDRPTPEEVRRVFGPPRHIARQILSQRYLEQWIYDQPLALRLDFEFLPGQQPRLLAVHRSRPGVPR